MYTPRLGNSNRGPAVTLYGFDSQCVILGGLALPSGSEPTDLSELASW
ncbi:MAG: hypothetical protein Q8K63_00315 [Acidimicrobiales bacterium]|nr:hypothetical protein [Acidimicrobiales bacterium]